MSRNIFTVSILTARRQLSQDSWPKSMVSAKLGNWCLLVSWLESLCVFRYL